MSQHKVADSVGPHPEKPSADWLTAFAEHILRTGQPETLDDLDWTMPPAWSRPHILRTFDVDRKRRPLKDMAPCAICSPTHEKCLNGMYLVWYGDEGVIRAVGPECGGEIGLLATEKVNFDRRQRQLRVEAFLEQNLPRVPAMILALEALEPGLSEAERLHAKFRHDIAAIPKRLRQIRNKEGGVLSVSVEMPLQKSVDNPDDDDDGPKRVGPRGFGRGHGAVDTYTENFGPIAGDAMFAAEFTLWHKLDVALAVARTAPDQPTTEDVFEWMCANENLELFEYIEKQLIEIESDFYTLVDKLTSTRSFFAAEFLARLDAWGSHPANGFELRVELANGVYAFEHDGRRSRLKPNFAALDIRPEWPCMDAADNSSG